MRRLASLLSVLALSLTASAQEVTLYGQVEDVQNTANQWFLDCTNIQLQSAGVQLAPFHRQYVKLRGTNIGTQAQPRINVSAIEAFPQVANLGGDRRPGSRFEFDVLLAPGTPFAAYLGVGSTFLPVGSLGTWYLSAANALVRSGITTGPITTINIPIPNDASLVGLDVFAQAIFAPAGSDPILSNVDCKTIRN